MSQVSRWDPAYERIVLSPGFEHARRHFFNSMMKVNVAHALMLVRQGILAAEKARTVLAACRRILNDGPPAERYDPRFEDLFFLVEDRLAEIAGEEAAGDLHLALSRNDLDAAMYRLVLREEWIQVARALVSLRKVVLDLAGRHVRTVMPAHTHGQQAQPTTLAHYLAGAEAQLSRDVDRLLDFWPRLNRSPLGAAALATTAFPIDREYVAQLLGFEGLVENSYDAVAGADCSAEYAACLQVLLTGISRLLHDLLFWCTNEVAALRLHPSTIQISSIMPQKRNPVALEHLRGFTARALGDAGTVMHVIAKVPFGDVNDVSDDLQPVLRRLSTGVVDVLQLLSAVLAKVEVDRGLLFSRASAGFSSLTELADTLVRESKMPFRTSHAIASRIVDELAAGGDGLHGLTLNLADRVALEIAGRQTGLTQERLREAVDPVRFVEIRSVRGGPAPAEMERYLGAAARKLGADERAVEDRARSVRAAGERLDAQLDQALSQGDGR